MVHDPSILDEWTAKADALWRAEPFVEGRYVETADGPVWVRDGGGTGHPVLMLHANTGTSESWQFQFEALTRAGLRPIALDRPGKGCSPSGSKPKPVAETIEVLARAMDLETFALVGVAGGSFVAIDYAHTHPQRVSHLLLLATTGQFSETEIDAAVARIEIPEIRKQDASYRELGPSYRARDPEGVVLWMALHDHAFHQKGSAAPSLITPNRYDKLKSLKCPLRVVAGGADLIAPPALMRIWMRELPQHELHVICEAGHAPQWEEPGAASEHILSLLQCR